MINNPKIIDETDYYEKLVLAKVIQFPDMRSDFMLSPEHFLNEYHSNIAKSIIDEPNITEQDLMTNSITDPHIYGDNHLLKEIMNMKIASKHGFNGEQQNVYDLYKHRQANELIHNYQSELPNDENLNAIYQRIDELNQFDLVNVNKKRQTLMNIFDKIHSDGRSPIVKTKFDSVDHIIDGFKEKQFNVIAARPSVGKTAFALQLAMNMSNEFTEITFCSAESSAENMTERILSNISSVHLGRFGDPASRMTPDDVDKVMDAISLYEKMNIEIVDEMRFTPDKIRNIAMNMNQNKHRIIIVDYLQLMKSDKRNNSRYEEVSDISRELKIIANTQSNLTIIALAQLNRAVEQRQDKKPNMSDLRDSGQLEQDANIIMFLYREDYHDEEKPQDTNTPSPLNVLVSKNKDGPIGMSELQFYKQVQRVF